MNVFGTAILGGVLDKLFAPADTLRVTVYPQAQDTKRLPYFIVGMVVAYAALKVVK